MTVKDVIDGADKKRWKDMTDEEWKESVGKPEFFFADMIRVRGFVEDKDESIWAFLEVDNNWMYRTNSARLNIEGDVIEIACRVSWIDEGRSETTSGDAPLIGIVTWRDLTGLHEPSDWKIGCNALGAVKVPFKPRELKIVDC